MYLFNRKFDVCLHSLCVGSYVLHIEFDQEVPAIIIYLKHNKYVFLSESITHQGVYQYVTQFF